MPIDTMDILKEVLSEQERLFSKLNKTGKRFESIDFDESGLYDEAEATAFRHWNTLTTKLAHAIRERIPQSVISVKKCNSPAEYKVVFVIQIQENDETLTETYEVDYSQSGQISLLKI